MIILNVALYTIPHLVFLTDVYIDERRIIKEEERPQTFAKGSSDFVEIYFNLLSTSNLTLSRNSFC